MTNLSSSTKTVVNAVDNADYLAGLDKHMAALEDLRVAAETIQRMQWKIIDDARAAGTMTWSEVGYALGTTKQAAQQRFGQTR